jgi:hypothetical protein
MNDVSYQTPNLVERFASTLTNHQYWTNREQRIHLYYSSATHSFQAIIEFRLGSQHNPGFQSSLCLAGCFETLLIGLVHLDHVSFTLIDLELDPTVSIACDPGAGISNRTSTYNRDLLLERLKETQNRYGDGKF